MRKSVGPIVVLTGAGISAESGIRTFRDQNGLWENHRIEDVATPEGFRKNPELVQSFYNARRAQLVSPEVKPNPAHLALAKLESESKDGFLLITQNVDNLHERAGSKNLIHMHGELLKARCLRTNKVFEWSTPISRESRCVCCDKTGTLRPHIVWFGEMPLEMERIERALLCCKLFLAIGTSGQVYPAAGFVKLVPAQSRRVEINAERSAVSEEFEEQIIGPAGEKVPAFVESLV